MAAAAWVCLLLPLASALAITSGGTAIPRRIAGYVSTLSRRCELALPKDRKVRVLVRACVEELRSNAPPIVRGLPTPLPPTRRSRTRH